MQLGIIDQIVLFGLLWLAVAIGLASGRKNKDLESYLLGGRALPWWAILGSIVATETSTATVLSVPGVGFSDTGMRWLQISFGFLLGRAIVVGVFLPLYFEGRLMTAYQVLQRRLGSAVKSFASALFLVTRNLGDGLRLYLAAAVLETVFGWPLVGCVLAMGTVTIAYTFFGGLRSVVWNDCIQLLIYLVGGLSAVVLLTRLVPGGWQEITEFAAQTGRLRLVDWRFSLSDPYNVWAGLLGGAVLTIGTHGTDHMMVQRYLSARSRREAGRAIIWSAVVVMAQFALFLWIGVQLACFYSGSAAVESIKADQVFARFIVDHFPQNVGLVGLMLAAILAAAMSTLSSSLNASASALLNDFYLPARRRAFRRVGGSHHGSPRPRISLKTVWVPVPAKQRGHRRLADHAVAGDRTEDSQLLKLSKLMTLGFGGLQMIIGVWASTLEESVINNALTIAGFSAGLLLGIFALGLAWRPISPAAVIAGAVLGAIVLGTVSFLLKSDGGRPLIAWPWMALVGSGTTFVAGSVCRFVIPASAAGGRTE